MGNKFLTSNDPEYTALKYLINNGTKLELYEDEVSTVLWEAKNRYLKEINNIGIKSPHYDSKKVFKRQAVGIFGEYSIFRIACIRHLKVKWDFLRKLDKADIFINGFPLGVKTSIWNDNGPPMTPQIDPDELKLNPIPQAIVYINFNDHTLLDLGYEASINKLKVNWISLIGVVNASTLINGLDKDYGIGTNPKKYGFIKFSKIIEELERREK